VDPAERAGGQDARGLLQRPEHPAEHRGEQVRVDVGVDRVADELDLLVDADHADGCRGGKVLGQVEDDARDVVGIGQASARSHLRGEHVARQRQLLAGELRGGSIGRGLDRVGRVLVEHEHRALEGLHGGVVAEGRGEVIVAVAVAEAGPG